VVTPRGQRPDLFLAEFVRAGVQLSTMVESSKHRKPMSSSSAICLRHTCEGGSLARSPSAVWPNSVITNLFLIDREPSAGIAELPTGLKKRDQFICR